MTSAVSAGDIDGDGDADVAIATPKLVALYRNFGDGSLADPETIAFEIAPSDVAIADVSADGNSDLLVAHNQFGSAVLVSVFLSDGNQGFHPPIELTGEGRLEALEVSDLEGDGDLVPTVRTLI